MWQELTSNPALGAGLLAWLLAQILKVPINYLATRQWDWGLWVSTGKMPSSHSALICATTLSIGLNDGFDTSAFALGVAIAMVILYDAAGVRRQAGIHAQRINQLIEEIFRGEPISDVRLKEVLGHTPPEVVGGVILGLSVALVLWLLG